MGGKKRTCYVPKTGGASGNNSENRTGRADPRAVAEAMACGTWPIVYADTACAEVVEHGKGQIVTGDLPELEAAIRNCIQQGVPGDIAPAAAVFSGERFGREGVNIYEQKAGKER